MNQSIKKEDKTIATLLHISVFSQFFIPLGNFILPLIIWCLKKENEFIDRHGRSVLNFQISLYLYATLILTLSLTVLAFMGISI